MDSAQLSKLRKSTRKRLTVDIATPCHRKKCCQNAYEEALERGASIVLEELEIGVPDHSSSICPDIIEEQDEGSDENSTILADRSSIASAFSTNVELWCQCNTYPIVMGRHRGEQAVLGHFNSCMDWLDEVLATAKAQFGSEEVDILPKTPAVKRTRKQKPARKSSLPVAPDTLKKPVRRTTRAAAMKARDRLESTNTVKEKKKEKKQNTRSTRSQKNAAEAADVTLSSSSSYLSVASSVKSVPKKIARFSQLSHVKDKVDAFEKISEGTPIANNASTPNHQINSQHFSTTPRLSSSALMAEAGASQDSLDHSVTSQDTLDHSVTSQTPATLQKKSKNNDSMFQSPETVVSSNKTSRSLKRSSRSGSLQDENTISSKSRRSSKLVNEPETSPGDMKTTLIKKSAEKYSMVESCGEKKTVVESSQQARSVSMEMVSSQLEDQSSPDSEMQLDGTLDSSVFLSLQPENNLTEEVEEKTAEKGKAEENKARENKAKEKRAEEKRAEEKRAEEKRAEERRAEEKRAKEKRAEEKRVEEKIAEEKRVEEKRAEEKRAEEKRAEEKRAEEKRAEEKRVKEKRAEEKRAEERKVKEKKGEDKTIVETDDEDADAPTVVTEAVEEVIAPAPQRMTRSKMRRPPPTLPVEAVAPKATKKVSPMKAKTPPRMKSPARTTTRMASADRSQVYSSGRGRVPSTDRTRLASADRADSAVKKKTHSDPRRKMSRSSSDSSMYNSSSVVRTLTKASSYSRINKNVNTSMSKQHTVSTPDMSRSQSVVKSFIKGNTSRTSPQNTPSLGRAMFSFLTRATPQKTLSKEEEAEKKQQQLREKQELERQRLEEAEKLRVQKVDARKRERAEKMERAKVTRQAKLDEIKNKQQEKEKKTQQKNEICNQALEKKQKEERQRALAREQKVKEAEERRRKEEEKRQQKLKAAELEQKKADKKKEEAERLRKMHEAESVKEQKQKLMNKVKEDGQVSHLIAPPAAKSHTTNIYEVISNKTAALSEERKALAASAAAFSIDKPNRKMNSTFNMEDSEPDFVDPNVLDEEDEFEDPKFAKCVKPSWATGNNLNKAVVNQYDDSLNGFKRTNEILGVFKNYTPDLTKIFKEHKPRFFTRTSSAMWHSPPLKPSNKK